ncbi:COX15/CtaA family protein [Runella slithyformis]|uniref:Cytochrome oxidase assembly n=1 Tax=Runella slithyformis (strain ATCC 29530 / DSM 19594 / LMG 11500 / NCIMB 11436 / LSU 4) TaxID=761193 RepID=A0A7U3ZLE9_RUNSL|nr:COX15/CtaA family protein [Runella slithyformis]AEI49358.1 cytochrome oxidase assembly [Runella slithyformis DSM 19594]
MTNSRLIDENNSNSLFRKLALLTVVVVYILILIGGIVRSTGSGMGCPDWPKCFGSWVPPTEISQLPPNYQEIYGAKLKGEIEFNATKTWIEYLNRLFGVFTGILIFGTLLASIPFLKKDRPVFYMSLAAFLLTGFQGWLGSKVVSAELSPFIVTLHMLLAIVIVFVLLYVTARSYSGYVDVEKVQNRGILNKWLKWTISLSLLQVVIGTQVREAMDVAITGLGNAQRDKWIDNLGIVFYIHRSFSIVIFLLHAGLLYLLTKNSQTKGLIHKLSSALLWIVFVEIITGVILAYLNVPPVAQPIHLTLAIVSVGVQFVVWLLLNAESVFKKKRVLRAENMNV